MRKLKALVGSVCCAMVLIAVAGCDQGPSPSGLTGALPSRATAGAPAQLAMGAAAVGALEAPRQQANTLAYEHVVDVELDGSSVLSRLEALRSACAADDEHGCTILNVSTSQHENTPYGTIRVRLAPGGVDDLVTLASEGGRLLSRNTSAEDLAQPIADTDRQLALLTLHRERLTAFLERKDIAVEQLITVSKELATVQAQIEELTNQRANLRRRVDTDLLTINLRVPRQQMYAQQTVVRDALRAFGTNFREAIASVITFIAYLVPWLIILLPGLFVLRWLWRLIGRRLKRGEQRAA